MSSSTTMTKVATATTGFFTNPNTWVVVLAIVLIAYLIYQMYELYNKGSFKDNWVAWTINIVAFLVAITGLVMWGMGYVYCADKKQANVMFTKGTK